MNEGLSNVENDACLCRAYLGKNSVDVDPARRQQELQTLQNFPIYLDMMQEMQMDPFSVARDMALGIAAIHWTANYNALDVEFVFGSAIHNPQKLANPTNITNQNLTAAEKKRPIRFKKHEQQSTGFRNRAVQLWMIDFNKVERFDPSVFKNYHANIRQLVADTRSADGPYHPRVLVRNEYEWNLWVYFAKSYIKASQVIFQAEFGRNTYGDERSQQVLDLNMKRPVHFIDVWMEFEAAEGGMNVKTFAQRVKDNG